MVSCHGSSLGRFFKVFYPVFPPNKNAELVLEFINAHRLKA